MITIDNEIKKLNEQAKIYSDKIELLFGEIKKVIVGQDEIIRKLVLSIIADGHVLLEGVPGLAKTMMIKTLSDAIKTDFQRIQFTPDLLPADIIGTKIFNMNDNSFSTKKGPIFSNFILADEINRAPPKCQSALLESMQERQVTIGEETFMMAKPFHVLATMNPLENEGVYTLPEAQVDRFMFKLVINYPSKDEEKEIMNRQTNGISLQINEVLNSSDIIDMQKFCQKIYADEKILDYIADIVDATRNPADIGVNGFIAYGASPRASIWLVLAAKANALVNGRGYVIPEDVQEIAQDVLRHRIILTYEAEAEEITSENIIDKIMKNVKVP